MQTNQIYAGKIVPKSLLTKQHQREKVSISIISHQALCHRAKCSDKVNKILYYRSQEHCWQIMNQKYISIRGETVIPVSRYRHEISSRLWVNYRTCVSRKPYFLICSVPNSHKSLGVFNRCDKIICVIYNAIIWTYSAIKICVLHQWTCLHSTKNGFFGS